uniref:Uncharacterized protein n=1 Tax=Steinernema glaseri TaxID=37863 RepID=A0A1I7YXW5_9BILA
MSLTALFLAFLLASLTFADDPFSEESFTYSAKPYRVYRSRAPFGFSRRSPQRRENRLEVFIDQDQRSLSGAPAEWNSMLRQPIVGFSPWTDYEGRFRRHNA